MLTLFQYNWQVREEWFKWCEQFPHEVLAEPRTGGLGSILETLFHIVDIEQAWINGLNGKPEFHYDYIDYSTLEKVKSLSVHCHPHIKNYLEAYHPEKDAENFQEIFTYGEIIRHVIAHEIHHVGQLSVWARELDVEPVSANLIFRGLN